jgi:hypothetical protein
VILTNKMHHYGCGESKSWSVDACVLSIALVLSVAISLRDIITIGSTAIA